MASARHTRHPSVYVLVDHSTSGHLAARRCPSGRTFTWRALHCRQPNRLFLWPRRGIEVSLTSEVALDVALPQLGWVTLDAATRWCGGYKANARRGGKAVGRQSLLAWVA